MAKRKNPLQDIDAFLSQEATNLVTPNQLPDQEEVKIAKEEKVPKETQSPDDIPKLLSQWIKSKGDDFRPDLYQALLQTLEELPNSNSRDKMLINTLLYLQNPDSWKEKIEHYWQKSS